MAITDANTNTNQTLPYLPSLRPSLAPAQPKRTAEDLPKPQVQDTVLGSTTAGKTGYFTGERVRRLIAQGVKNERFHCHHSIEHNEARRLERRLAGGLDSVEDGACWLWKRSLAPSGYGQLSLSGVTVTAHRASFLLANGPIPDGVCVLHSCDVRACVNPDHLHLGSPRDNARERQERGRGNPPIGERQGSSRLRSEDVLEIRKLLRGGVVQLAIGMRYEVSDSTISAINVGRTWKHIKP